MTESTVPRKASMTHNRKKRSTLFVSLEFSLTVLFPFSSHLSDSEAVNSDYKRCIGAPNFSPSYPSG